MTVPRKTATYAAPADDSGDIAANYDATPAQRGESGK